MRISKQQSICCRGTGFGNAMDSILIRIKPKTSQEISKSLQKSLEPTLKPKVIYTDNSLEFGKACEDLSWNHCTSTPHRSETNGIAEREVRRVKEGTSAVLLQSGLDEKWCADSPKCYCYLRNLWPRYSVWLDGRISPFLPKTCQDSTSSGRKFYRKYSSVMYKKRVRFGKETFWSQTLKSWTGWTHLNSTPEGSMQRKCSRHKEVETSFSRSQMEQYLEEIRF